jgi:hypothetical protein
MDDVLSASPTLFQSPRIHPSLYKGIVTRVRKFYRRSDPSGCAQNIKAQVRDIDKAVEANRLREQIVDEYAQTELLKLNLNKVPNKAYKKSLTISYSPSKQPPRTANTQILELKRQQFLSYRTALPQFNNRASTSVGQPRVRIRTENNRKIKRLASLDSIMKSCDELKPKLKPDLDMLENEHQKLLDNSQSIKEFLSELEDFSREKEGKEGKRMKKDQARASRRMKKVMSLEPEIKNEMLSMTRKLKQLGGNKVWRHNHAEFMASAEKVINSLPKTRQ